MGDSPREDRRAASRASAAEQELKSLTYAVCHDLAASFRHLMHFSNLLLKGRDEALTDSERLYGERLRAAGVRCEAMLSQLSVYSSIQQRRLEKVRQDATPILRLAMLRGAAAAQAAGAEIAAEPMGEVYADGFLLEMAFGALIDNAITFTRATAPPRIATRPAHDRTFWRARISDNGPGVDSAYREAAFQMFRRLHGEGAYPGVGAGLAITRRIARLHGGEAMFLDSNQGACVELALPHAPRSARTPHKTVGE